MSGGRYPSWTDGTFNPASQPLDHSRPAPPVSLSDSSRITTSWTPARGNSAPFVLATYYTQETRGSGLDIVTIALALLALVAVFGLIPLYIIVFRAWNGG